MSSNATSAFAAISAGVSAITAAGAAFYGYTLAAIVAGCCLIVAGIGLAAGLAGEK